MFRKITLLAIALPFFTISQTGPGGVGSSDGTTNLALWLDASTISSSNGSQINTWQDASGYGHHFSNGAGAIFQTEATNGYSALNFNGVTHYFERAYTELLATDQFTIFTATNVGTSNTTKTVLSNRDNSATQQHRGYMLYATPNSNIWEFGSGRNTDMWETNDSQTSTSSKWSSQLLSYQKSLEGKMLNINGAAKSHTYQTMYTNSNKPFRIGAGKNETTPDDFFKGEIGEVILFNTILNATRKIIVNNYLAAKYNFSLEVNDVFDEDKNSSGNFDHEVAGIGRLSDSDMHTSAQGTGIVKVQNASNLDNNEFFMWGHNNGLLQVIYTADLPNTVQARFDRVWRVSEVSTSGESVNVGAIDLSFDLTDLGSVVASDLRLLVDTDNDGFFSDELPISGAIDAGENVFSFNGVTAMTNNVRFTLGSINIVQTPLPIELVDFTALPLGENYVKLDWQTASELNNDYFTVERSQDGVNWETLKELNGAGNSTTLRSYTLFDDNPFAGVSYYRLFQTDLNGTKTIFKTLVVNLSSIQISHDEIIIYPNPTKSNIVVQAKSIELSDLHVINALGQDVSDLIFISNLSDEKRLIDLSNLEKGIYSIQFKSVSRRILKD
jgi:hypothetical protein